MKIHDKNTTLTTTTTTKTNITMVFLSDEQFNLNGDFNKKNSFSVCGRLKCPYTWSQNKHTHS